MRTKKAGKPLETQYSQPEHWKMEDPYLAATLILSYKFHYAENAFSRPANIRRCFPPKEFDDEPVIGSREPTPARSLSPRNNTGGNPEGKHCILAYGRIAVWHPVTYDLEIYATWSFVKAFSWQVWLLLVSTDEGDAESSSPARDKSPDLSPPSLFR